jgi:aspartate carbamoyltransferase catalytic subunit
MFWSRKDLLGLEDLSKEELELILTTADSFKEVSSREIKKVPALRGKTVVTFFMNPPPAPAFLLR